MYRRKAKGWYKHIDFIILDIICLELSFLIAYVIRHGAVNPYHFNYIVVQRSCLDLLILYCSLYAIHAKMY